ncbi:MAG TPA: HAMP domain-containing sensor histidine kinase [Polyangia bacterium]|nr:HAMP domain-containing sensor histidine kinase [Polyangia bacterium]
MKHGWWWRHHHHHHHDGKRRHRWHGPWGLWGHIDPEVREKILAEAKRAYASGFARRHPWDRVFSELVGGRPGWPQRIQWELRLHYGAHLHRRLFLWFGAAIFLSVVTTLCVSHFGHRDHTAHPLRALFLFGVPGAVLWVASGRVARRIARPLYQLTRAAQDLGNGNLKARVAAEDMGFDELGVLSLAFNDMAGRLERQRADERELLAAVSHELRTPLARIRLLVEIGRERAGAPGTLDEIEREAIEIDALVGELLASARLEFQAVTPKPLDAVEAARRALERAGAPADRLVAPAGAMPLPADPTLLARALANLIDNARKHGDGLDRLTVEARDGWVSFAVTDRGRGFAPGDETRVFERFYRGAGGGSQAHGSLGLGLSLVKRIADAHGGRVAAANLPGGGARVVLELPIAGPA